MATLTVTARGQVTFRKDVLNRVGVRPGGRLQVNLLPDGRAELKAEQPTGSWDSVRGCLAGQTNGTRLTIDQLNDAIGDAGAAAGAGSK